MNTSILEILQSGADVTINVKATDLKEFGRYLIDTATKETKERIREDEEDILLTVDEVMKRLGIKDRTTLWRWHKKGYLVPAQAGKKLLYRLSQIDHILNSKSKNV